jgi:hypothetical protein
METYSKNCRKCHLRYETTSRNHQFCPGCRGYKKRPRQLKSSKYRIKPEAFRDRELISYLMGFCSSDGSLELLPSGEVYTVRYISTDREIIEKITTRLGYTRPISINREFEDHRKTAFENILYSDNARHFGSLGLTKKKEDLTLDSMDVAIGPFLRGLCDGDGTISPAAVEVTFLGQERMLQSVRNRLLGYFDYVQEPRKAKDRNLWLLQVGGTTRVGKLFDLMYDGATIYLERKFRVMEEMRERSSVG